MVLSLRLSAQVQEKRHLSVVNVVEKREELAQATESQPGHAPRRNDFSEGRVSQKWFTVTGVKYCSEEVAAVNMSTCQLGLKPSRPWHVRCAPPLPRPGLQLVIGESTVGFLFGYKTEPIRNFKLTLLPTPLLNTAESSR